MILVTGRPGVVKPPRCMALCRIKLTGHENYHRGEIRLEIPDWRIDQVQVNPKIGLTFSSVLRASLRQDPDILLVGEMRDDETVEIGLRGALTGMP